MIILSDNGYVLAGAIVYGVGLSVMFAMSCLYHSFRHGSAVKRLFRRFDYSSIYLLIGATFALRSTCFSAGRQLCSCRV